MLQDYCFGAFFFIYLPYDSRTGTLFNKSMISGIFINYLSIYNKSFMGRKEIEIKKKKISITISSEINDRLEILMTNKSKLINSLLCEYLKSFTYEKN